LGAHKGDRRIDCSGRKVLRLAGKGHHVRKGGFREGRISIHSLLYLPVTLDINNIIS